MTTGEDPGLRVERLANGGSRLLAALAVSDLRVLAERSRRVRFGRGEVLAAADAPPPAALFVENGVASTMKRHDGERRTEICLTGREGVVGTALLVPGALWPYETLAQTDALTAVRVEADDLRALFDRSAALRTILLQAIHLQAMQIGEGLVSAAWQQITARLARWLLMYRDRLGSARIEVTHQFMAAMVGAQRPRITAALHELESEGAVRTHRGYVVIRDDVRLERFADGTYGVVEREEQRLLAPGRPGADPPAAGSAPESEVVPQH